MVKVAPLCWDSQPSQGSADTTEATTLPMPTVINKIGNAQQLVPSKAKPKLPANEVLVAKSSLFMIGILFHDRLCFETTESKPGIVDQFL